MSSESKIPVAVLGATGTVGQRFVTLLADHPTFHLAALTASERSTGRRYADSVQWVQTNPLPAAARDLPVLPSEPAAVAGCPLVFSALDANAADTLEHEFADAGLLVVSNARSHRMDPDVPLLVPEVNPDHLALLDRQPYAGGILTNPNCSTIGLVMTLKPLADAFGIARVHVVTMQAVSGAGLPGVASLRILDNVIPFIAGEEEKLEKETGKILGELGPEGIEHHPVAVSAQCNRVPVVDGHTLCVSVELERFAPADEVLAAWREFQGEPQRLGLPTAPRAPIHVCAEPDAPQPRLHRDLDRGMATTIGRLRPCPLFHYRYVALSHNTIRGAAGGALLVAELAVAKGRLAAAGVRR